MIMQQGQQSGQAQTGTRDETYDIIAVLYHALHGAENCQRYQQDASKDEELSSFFEESMNQQRQIANRGKQLLQARLGGSGDGHSGSAFSFNEGEQGASDGQNKGGGGSTSGQTGGGGSSGGSSTF
jgi:hypothetical protein